MPKGSTVVDPAFFRGDDGKLVALGLQSSGAGFGEPVIFAVVDLDDGERPSLTVKASGIWLGLTAEADAVWRPAFVAGPSCSDVDVVSAGAKQRDLAVSGLEVLFGHRTILKPGSTGALSVPRC